MADFKIKPTAGTGNKLILESEDGTDVLTTSDSGVAITAPTIADLSNVTGTLPVGVIGGSGLQNGITHASQWRLHTSESFETSEILDANLEPVDTYGFATVGSVMTEASGIFTFPVEGMWFIHYQAYGRATTGAISYAEIYIDTTVNNSSYNMASPGIASAYTTNAYWGAHCNFFFDVTNTTNNKVRFRMAAPAVARIDGATSANFTSFTFIRLGDT
jgi:hypothetical protein